MSALQVFELNCQFVVHLHKKRNERIAHQRSTHGKGMWQSGMKGQEKTNKYRDTEKKNYGIESDNHNSIGRHKGDKQRTN